MPIRKRWSKEELSSLEKDYGILSPNELEKKYCIRYSAIKRAANNHGIKMRKIWSDEELSLLKEDYGILLPGELEKKFGINYSDIRSAAARHNIKSKRYTGKRRFWTKAEEENLKIDWETSTLTAKELAAKYDRSIESIRNKAKELKLQKKELFVSPEQEEKIIFLYGTQKENGGKAGAKYVASRIGHSESAIRAVIRRNGGNILKYGEANRIFEVNDKYFDEGIRSHESAYILGLFYADGYNNEQKGALGINLKACDALLLQNISAILAGNREVKIYSHKYKDEHRKYAHLYIGNRKLSESLAKLGVVQNKSLIAEPPLLENDLFMSFLRGVSDGDGSIIFQKKTRRLNWTVCGGAKVFMYWIYNKIKELFPSMHISWREDVQRKNPLYTVSIGATENTIIFLNEMYRDVWQYHSLLYLPRKYKQITMWKREREAYEYGDLSRTLPERAKILHRQTGLGILQ